MDFKIFIILCVQTIVSLIMLYNLVSINVASRESQQSLDKVVVLLTVLANQQGATQADVEKALGK